MTTTTARTTIRSSNAALKAMRVLHLYLGVFTAPALLFFAFTGAVQTFSLHETTAGSAYKPPAWAVTLAQIHKKQTPVVTPKRPLPPQAAMSGKAEAPATAAAPARGLGREVGAPQTAARNHHPLPLKIFFLLASIALTISTVSGVYMAYRYTRDGRVVTALLVLGAVVPVALVFV